MASSDDSTAPEVETDSGADEAAPEQGKARRRLPIPKLSLPKFATWPLRGAGDMWQIPAAVVGIALIVLGLRTWIGGASGPDFDGALASVETYVEANRYDEALELLNGPILANLDDPLATSEVWGRFHALRGDVLYLGQKAKGIDMPENFKHVLTEYKTARQYDPGVIDGRRIAFMADSYIALGQVNDARALIEQIPATDVQRRHSILKGLIESHLDATPPRREEALKLLATLKTEADITPELRHWIVVKQNEVRLALGYSDRVIDELLIELQRLDSQQSPEAADLFLLLGQAYLAGGALEPAREQLLRAESTFPPGSPKLGEVQIGLGRIAQLENAIEDARDRFALVVDQFRGTGSLARGYLGLAESEADLGRFNESLDAYRTLVQLKTSSAGGKAAAGVSKQEVEESLAHRHSERFTSGDYRTAMQFVQLEEQLFEGQEPPLDMILRLADTRRRLGAELLGVDPDDADARVDLSSIDPVTLEEARVLLSEAGEAYHRHAKRVIVRDAELAGASQWLAGDSFERAGDLRRAATFFADFLQTQAGSPRAMEAKFRLARLHQALDQLDDAITLYQEVVSENPNSNPAARSYVPLARAYLLRNAEGDHAQAEVILEKVLDGGIFEPESIQFRDALFELGRLHRKDGEFAKAIERLTEALERYPDSDQATRLKFDLADSYRESAQVIDEKLNEAMPQSERLSYMRLKRNRLSHALELYEQVRQELELLDPNKRAELDEEMLRNAIFYRGDCAFDLEDYDSAITYYDTAAQRYANDASSLVAMVQIVNCYMRLNKTREARTAHERARARLNELPDDAWTGTGMPMNRQYWENWLESSEWLAAASS